MAPALTSVFMNDHDMLPSLFNDDDILSIFPRFIDTIINNAYFLPCIYIAAMTFTVAVGAAYAKRLRRYQHVLLIVSILMALSWPVCDAYHRSHPTNHVVYVVGLASSTIGLSLASISMTLVFSECVSSIISPELATFFITPCSFLTGFSLVLVPLRLCGLAYIALFLSPSPITGHEHAMQRLIYASHSMDMLKFANDQNINLCIAHCIVVVGFTYRTYRMRNMSKLIEERLSPLAAAVCQCIFMYANSRVLSHLGGMIGDDGVPFPSAASWVIRVIICILACMQVDKLYRNAGLRSFMHLGQTRHHASQVWTDYETGGEAMTMTEKKSFVHGQV